MSLLTEIITVGTELTNGSKLDTNSQWLSRELEDLGHPVRFHASVSDSLEDQVQLLRTAVERSDLILMTGGLGPTLDDLARQAVAELLGVELTLHLPSLEAIEAFFQARGRTMPERNRLQALFPAGTEPLPNPVGTAPGIWCVIPRAERPPCHLASLPGVPSEMHRMFHEQVLPRLPASPVVIRKQVWHCFGLGESEVEQRLGELTARGRDPEVGITAHEATISLRIVAHGKSEEDCQAKLAATSQIIQQTLGQRVFGSGDTELEDVVVKLLAERGESLVTLECGPCAWLADRCLRAASRNGSPQTIAGHWSFVDLESALRQWKVLTHQEDGPAHTLSTAAGDDTQAIMSAEGLPQPPEELAWLASRVRAVSRADHCLAVWYPPVSEMLQPATGLVVLDSQTATHAHAVQMLGAPSVQHSRLAKTAVDLARRRWSLPSAD